MNPNFPNSFERHEDQQRMRGYGPVRHHRSLERFRGKVRGRGSREAGVHGVKGQGLVQQREGRAQGEPGTAQTETGTEEWR